MKHKTAEHLLATSEEPAPCGFSRHLPERSSTSDGDPTQRYVSNGDSGPLGFEESGFLKAGIHEFTLDDLQALTFTNPYRYDLGCRFLAFVEWTESLGGFSRIYVGGGFLSCLPHPKDVDVILETRAPFGPQAFRAMEKLFLVGLDTLWRRFSVHVHFWMENAPDSIMDYRSFFQYVPSGGNDVLSPRRKGVARLTLGSLGPDSEEKSLSAISDPVSEVKQPGYNQLSKQVSVNSGMSAMKRTLIALAALVLSNSISIGAQSVGGDTAAIDGRLNDLQTYPLFTIPTDSSSTLLPATQYTISSGTLIATINNVQVIAVFSVPMDGFHVASSASNVVFYGPVPNEKTQLTSNILPSLVSKLGCTVFSFQIDGIGQDVSSTPYWSETQWFDAALQVRDMLIEKFHLERRLLILVGYSGGGGMILNFAGTYPDQIEAVAAQAPNVVPAVPKGNKINWLMVVNRGDSNRIVMKPFYEQLRAQGCRALYCETTPERARGHYHAPSSQSFDLIYSFLASVLDQRRLTREGITDVTRMWTYAAPAAPLERYAIVKTIDLQPEDLSSGKFDLLPSLPFTIAWSRVSPPEQNILPAGSRSRLILNFPAKAVPDGVVLYYDQPEFTDVAREVEDINSLAEHGYLVVSTMTAGPEDFVATATSWIQSQSKIRGLHVHLIGNGLPGARFISKIAARNDISFRSVCLLDFTGSSFQSDYAEGLTTAAKECGMYGFYTYAYPDESDCLADWAKDLVNAGAEGRGCFNFRISPQDFVALPETQRQVKAETQALAMAEGLMKRADSQ